jgi:hypothetical protein
LGIGYLELLILGSIVNLSRYRLRLTGKVRDLGDHIFENLRMTMLGC